jgi:hypothetical protein
MPVPGGIFSAFTVPGKAHIAVPARDTVAQTETRMKLCLNTKASRQACKQRCLNRPG